MKRVKACLGLVLALTLAYCVSAQVLDRPAPRESRVGWSRSLSFQQKAANAPMPSHLWTSERTSRLPRAAAGTGAISGRVTQEAGGAGIEDVVVAADLLHCFSSYSSAVQSDANGDYLIEGLPPGDYEVSTSNDSIFVDVYWNDKLPWESPDTVAVVSDDTTEDIDFSLRAGGKISGTVFLPGSFFQGASIFAYDTLSRYVYIGWASHMVEEPAPYVIKGLPPGTYKVRTFNGLGFIDVYWDTASSWTDADPVLVTAGNTTSSINFVLDPGGVIQGTVSTPGKSFDGGILAYYASNPEWYAYWYPERGESYELTGLRGGYWKVLAFGDATHAFEWYNNQGTWADAATILVTPPGTVSGIDFSLEVGGSISGICDSRAGPLVGCEVVALESSSFHRRDSPTFWFVFKSDSSSNDGTYSIGGLRTGTYYVGASHGCEGMWYNNQTSMETADLVSVIMPGETPNIDFYLSTEVENQEEITHRPSEFELHQNYPNPFNPQTKIEYKLSKRGHVGLRIYNILGSKVRTLLDKDQPVGSYSVSWDGRNDAGQSVTSGVYLYRLEVDGLSQARRMLLLK